MAWMLLGIGVTLLIVGVTTAQIIAEAVEWYDTRGSNWVGNVFNIVCWALIGYPGAWLTFTHITGVGL